MSYLPPEQLLSDPLNAAADSLEKLVAPIRERIKNADHWQESHLQELVELLRDATVFEARLRLLAAQVQ